MQNVDYFITNLLFYLIGLISESTSGLLIADIDRTLSSKMNLKLLIIICILQSIAGNETSNHTGKPFVVSILFHSFHLLPSKIPYFRQNNQK